MKNIVANEIWAGLYSQLDCKRKSSRDPVDACAIRNSGGFLLKVEVEPDEISPDLLEQEIAASISIIGKGIKLKFIFNGWCPA